jgi:hypothetical protein
MTKSKGRSRSARRPRATTQQPARSSSRHDSSKVRRHSSQITRKTNKPQNRQTVHLSKLEQPGQRASIVRASRIGWPRREIARAMKSLQLLPASASSHALWLFACITSGKYERETIRGSAKPQSVNSRAKNAPICVFLFVFRVCSRCLSLAAPLQQIQVHTEETGICFNKRYKV